jgi:MFS family permease
LAGLLVSGPGWQWVFFVNVPVGVLVAAAVPVTVAASPRQATARVDVPGALLVTAGTGLLIYGLVEAGDRGWVRPPPWGRWPPGWPC